ncbi:MAG: sugar ABC transporter ATP-binding protein [Christensenellaceae bacterium]|jgi:ribose transport system ATP-binding protein
MGTNEYILEMRGVSKEFPGVKALDDVQLLVKPGETHALMGANGAGKSTLMKVLAGIYTPDCGEILLDGQEISIKNPAHAQQLGISIVFQELNVLPDLNVLENIFINREIIKGGFYDWKEMKRQAHEILQDLEIEIDISKSVCDLPIAQQQMVEIIKAVSSNARILILDEPTSSLSVKEVDKLYEIIEKLHNRGVAIIYISHRLDEIFRVSERLTLLRDGKWIFTEDMKDITREYLVDSIVGRKIEEEFPTRQPTIGRELLSVDGLSSDGYYEDISFTLHAGEIVGFAGLVGAGRTEVGKSIFGEFPYRCGEILVEGKPFAPKSSGCALKKGIAYATEDRKTEGLLLERSIRENESLASLKRVTKLGLINKHREVKDVTEMSKKLNVKTPSMEQLAVNLSGGNQQKVCLSKWMLTEPKIMILDEPTRGIDVGAKAEFYSIISDLAKGGVGVVLISSEETELLGLCDRIIVFREGHIVGEVNPKEDGDMCEKLLMGYMLGVDYREESQNLHA